MAREARKDARVANGGSTGLMASLAIFTVLGGGGGALLGHNFLPTVDLSRGATQAAEAARGETIGAHGAAPDHATTAAAAAPSDLTAQLVVKELPPVVTNLRGAARSLVRLQTAILFDPRELPNADALAPLVVGDITAFLGTLDLSAIEGADGLRRLQEELNERAATRSERRIRELIVEMLVVQ